MAKVFRDTRFTKVSKNIFIPIGVFKILIL